MTTQEENKNDDIKVGGRSLMFRSEEHLEELIDQYFTKIVGHKPITNEKGEPLADVNGKPLIKFKAPTKSGLARFLGFKSRQSIYDYVVRRDMYSDTMKKALLMLEEFNEEGLYDKNTFQGCKFWLTNTGWNNGETNINLNNKLDDKDNALLDEINNIQGEE